jgi:hypothetical protein
VLPHIAENTFVLNRSYFHSTVPILHALSIFKLNYGSDPEWQAGNKLIDQQHSLLYSLFLVLLFLCKYGLLHFMGKL